ncbi:MAG: bifunctional DNA-formamidopyrimidine glycosylase/DNA-(apurinic or apyrimidinic site) lyase [Patescibacteria group bacterium]|nr:bifunctional DNA-formamidopyrimidine glycosylase/DNA-(apurinic or apyrimidinic site) lyase [Patescibacteria group bacterium]
MPELPEVETIRRELDRELPGLEVREIICKDERLLKPDPEEVRDVVVGEKFEKVGRRAKLLIFRLSGSKNLLCHLRMSGRLLFRDESDPEDKYVSVIFKLPKGKELRFASARKFGYIKLANNQTVEEILNDYGPEPFKDLTLKKFKKIVSNSGAAVKNLLMDQKKIAGVGNIYANDALFLAKINPEKKAKQLTDSQIENLYKSLEQVLKEGMETGGASDQWYRDAYGRKGKYQRYFKVYGRAGETCSRCGGKIKRIKVGGRSTFFCPHCQQG